MAWLFTSFPLYIILVVRMYIQNHFRRTREVFPEGIEAMLRAQLLMSLRRMSKICSRVRTLGRCCQSQMFFESFPDFLKLFLTNTCFRTLGNFPGIDFCCVVFLKNIFEHSGGFTQAQLRDYEKFAATPIFLPFVNQFFSRFCVKFSPFFLDFPLYALLLHF